MLPSCPPLQTYPPYSCVIDPTLALSPYGVPLVKQLRNAMNVWVVREFLHILANRTFYLLHPNVLLTPKKEPEEIGEGEYQSLDDVLKSTKIWENFLLDSDLAGLNLFWVGDSLRESFLPRGKSPNLFQHWEFLVRSLDEHLVDLQDNEFLLQSGFRDTAALAVSLESAFILTYKSTSDVSNNMPPSICRILESWGIPCQQLDPKDPIADLERNSLCSLLVHTGLAKLLWANLNLIVLHLIVPEALSTGLAPELSNPESAQYQGSLPQKDTDLWSNAQGFWYQI